MLQIGLKHSETEKVSAQNTAATLGSGTLEVYATPAMARLMEYTAAQSIEGSLDAGQTTVGISLVLKHISATPIGCIVTCESELKEIDGRKLTFQLNVKDAFGFIGSAEHERFIVDSQKFLQRAQTKQTANND